jgi:hypothetical protein
MDNSKVPRVGAAFHYGKIFTGWGLLKGGPFRFSARGGELGHRRPGHCVILLGGVLSVNLARFICPSFFGPDSNSIWRKYAVDTVIGLVGMVLTAIFVGARKNH